MRLAEKLCGVITLVVLPAVLAAGAVTVTLSPNTGPPSPSVGPPSTLKVSGAGFPDSTAVYLYFDTTEVALAVANAAGSFAGISIQVPTTAVPGTHWVTAVAQGTTGTAAQASFTVQTNWSQFRYSALHRGRNPYENVLNSTNVGSIDLDWSYTTAGAITSSPAVSGGSVYFGSADDNLYALNATTGALLWKYTTGNSIVGSSPAVVSNTVYVGSTDDYLYAINATTGALVWKFKTGAAINSSPAVVGGVVYIGSTDDNVYAVNATTGAQVWKFATGNQVTSSPAVSNGLVFIGSYDDNLYAINATTGAEVWLYTTGNKISSSPAVSEEVVYFGSQDENLYAVNARTGVLLWKYAGGGAFETPAVANGTVYVGSDDGVLTWINAYTGTYIVKETFSTALVLTPTVLANGIVYVGNSNGYVFGFYLVVTASEVWRAAAGAAVTAAPTVANGVVYVASQDSNLYAYDLNGSTQVIRPPEKPDPKTLRPNPEIKPSNRDSEKDGTHWCWPDSSSSAPRKSARKARMTTRARNTITATRQTTMAAAA
jgi:outer membrane protein assembly factor BamB